MAKQKTTVYFVTYQILTENGNKLDFTHTFKTEAERKAFAQGIGLAKHITVMREGYYDE
jgi:hypothetical protein